MPHNAFPKITECGIRRVVTAIDATGKAVVHEDATVAGDPRALLLWGADAAPSAGDPLAVATDWWPPPGGVRVSLSTRRPDRDPSASHAQSWPDIKDSEGFHASQTTDIVIVIAGTIWLELDDGVEVELNAGDVVIQNATRHRWRNHGDGWPIMAVVMMGAIARRTGKPGIGDVAAFGADSEGLVIR